MVAKKIRDWELPFITLIEDTEIPEEVYDLDYIRVNRIERSIVDGWKSVFDSFNNGMNRLSMHVSEIGKNLSKPKAFGKWEVTK